MAREHWRRRRRRRSLSGVGRKGPLSLGGAAAPHDSLKKTCVPRRRRERPGASPQHHHRGAVPLELQGLQELAELRAKVVALEGEVHRGLEEAELLTCVVTRA